MDSTPDNASIDDNIQTITQILNYSFGDYAYLENDARRDHMARWFDCLKGTLLFLIYPNIIPPLEFMA